MRPGGAQFIPRPEAWRTGGPPPWQPRDHIPIGATADLIARRDPPQAHVPTFEDARHSAVLITLAPGPHGAEVLLTKRSMELSSHRGEISFPGGRVDGSETFVEAALREAHEEVALPPEAVRVIGQLDPLSTVVSKSYIVPIVGVVEEAYPLAGATREVDRVLWVPLAELTQADSYSEEWWGTPPLDRPMFFFHLDDETVWGATARMMHQLLRVALRIDGPEPPAW